MGPSDALQFYTSALRTEMLRLFLILGFVIVARRATFAASNPCLVAGPLVGGALFMRGASTSPGNLTLLLAIHRRESATATLVSFSHSALCHVEHPPVSVCLWDTPEYRIVVLGGKHARLLTVCL